MGRKGLQDLTPITNQGNRMIPEEEKEMLLTILEREYNLGSSWYHTELRKWQYHHDEEKVKEVKRRFFSLRKYVEEL